MNNFQRKGAPSNTQVGRAFEELARKVLEKNIEILLNHDYAIEIGVKKKKLHKFDLGSSKPAIIVECKSHTWTESARMPSAKMKNWSEAMFYFLVAPKNYRKIFFIQKDVNKRTGETLGKYYLRTHYHLIPDDVEFWECDVKKKQANKLERRPNTSENK